MTSDVDCKTRWTAFGAALDIPTVLVTHDLDDVFRLATHVLLLDRGRAVICDTVAAVTSRPDAGVIRRLIGSGSVMDAVVEFVDDTRGLTALSVNGVRLLTPAMRLKVGAHVRVRVPAREVILATERPSGLSLHNLLPAVVTAVEAETRRTPRRRATRGGECLAAIGGDARRGGAPGHRARPGGLRPREVSVRGDRRQHVS